ncbi:hypothetical protein SDJN02_12821, partial [Cucurbita argyrosperma subsp. argyrosperma]
MLLYRYTRTRPALLSLALPDYVRHCPISGGCFAASRQIEANSFIGVEKQTETLGLIGKEAGFNVLITFARLSLKQEECHTPEMDDRRFFEKFRTFLAYGCVDCMCEDIIGAFAYQVFGFDRLHFPICIEHNY